MKKSILFLLVLFFVSFYSGNLTSKMDLLSKISALESSSSESEESNAADIEGLMRGLDYFQQAIEKDPGYALSYAGISYTYNLLGRYSYLRPSETMPKAKAPAITNTTNRRRNTSKHVTLTVLSRIDTVKLPKTGQTTCYDANGNVIPCTSTGQDGEIQAGIPWPEPRFTDNGDGTMTDNLTGLMWLKDVNCANTIGFDPNNKGAGYLTWEQALDFVEKINNGTLDISSCASYTANYTDWRLANVREHRSLIDYSQYNPVLPSSHPFIRLQTPMTTDYYWTSTTYALMKHIALQKGCCTRLPKTDLHWVWPVRACFAQTITDDLVGTWLGEGVYYRNSDTGAWVKMASTASQGAARDINGYGTDDPLGIWPTQGGVWVKYSSSGTWQRLASSADWMACGKMRRGSSGKGMRALSSPFGGYAQALYEITDFADLLDKALGGQKFQYKLQKNLFPQQKGMQGTKISGPGDTEFKFIEQKNLMARKIKEKEREKILR